ncbi:MAG: prolipoprotein diacylglyceryl transferase [Candidatus Binatia bacterium]|nr:prolipoprotein diacylglyceryl transferase [Candidatus Binatia bacterium]
MVPVLLQLGPVALYSFGAMLALGFLAGGAVVGNQLEARGLDRRHASSIVWWAAIGGIIGSRILSLANDWSQFLDSPLDFIFSGAGFVWYGGLIGGAFSVTAYVLLRRLPWLAVADSVMVGLVLGQAIGRVGCQLSGDGDWGHVSDLPWAMAYTRAIFGWDYAPGVLVQPAPVYESLMYSGIFLWLLHLSRDTSRQADGTPFFAYLLLTGVARFLVEFIRIEPRLWLDLTEAQWIGLGTIATGAIGLLWVRRPAALAPAVAVLLTVSVLGCSGPKTAPEFVAQDLKGQAMRLTQHRGKVVFLNLWTTWCPPCREEMPAMQRLAKRLDGQGFVMIAVSEDDDASKVQAFVDEMKIEFPVLIDPTGSVGRAYGITGYPETFIIDRKGKQVARYIGPRDWTDPQIEKDLRTLIDEGRWVRGPDGN